MVIYNTLPASEPRYQGMRVTAGGRQDYPAYARVSAMPYNTVWPGCQRPMDQTEDSGFVQLQADGPFEMVVDYNHSVSEVVVRPKSKGISVHLEGTTARFILPGPGQYSVEADGFHNPLAVFVDPIGTFGVDLSDPSVIYYGPGVHHAGEIVLKSNDTLYIDDGAVVYGHVIAVDAKHVTIAGHGIIDNSAEIREGHHGLYPVTWMEDDYVTAAKDCVLPENVWDKPIPTDYDTMRVHLEKHNTLNGCIRFYSCHDVRVFGVTMRDSASFALIPANCAGLHFAFVKTIGMWKYNADGIDLLNSSDALIEDCWLRNFDDCMVLKGVKGFDRRNLARIYMRRLVVWCDWGRCLEIGAETCANEYHDILFEDCDLIHGAHIMMDIQNGDRARVHDVTFRNIRCEFSGKDMPCIYQSHMDESYEDAIVRTANIPKKIEGFDPEHMEYGLLMKSHNYCGVFSKDMVMGGVKDIRFENIQVYLEDGAKMPKSEFEGDGEEHLSENIEVIRLLVNGEPITDMEMANIHTNEYTRNITIR